MKETIITRHKSVTRILYIAFIYRCAAMFGKDVVGDVTLNYILKYNWLILDLARNHMKETIIIGNISLEDFSQC